MAQSTHKVLGSMTQSAMLHVGPQAEGRGVDLRAVERALQLVQSTSPSYILMASLDSARLAMEEGGARAFDEPVQVRAVYADVRAVQAGRVLLHTGGRRHPSTQDSRERHG